MNISAINVGKANRMNQYPKEIAAGAYGLILIPCSLKQLR